MNIPSATYRIQFNAGFTFDSAKDILLYLKEFGISHIYASPIFKSRQGSTHGYDIVDPSEINPDLGGIDKFNTITDELKNLKLFWLQDIVPNHVAFDSENHYLMDVLEKNSLSKYKNYFDIEWDHPYENLNGRVLAPFLGDFYGTCLDRGDIKLKFDKNGFVFNYYNFVFPMRIEDYSYILKQDLSNFEAGEGQSDTLLDLKKLINESESLLNSKDQLDRDTRITNLKISLNNLYQKNQKIACYIDSILHRLNGVEGQPQTFDDMDCLLNRQNFRYSFWKVGNEELNYRRFFTINTLLSLRTEERAVFEAVHALIFRLINEKKIDGIRIDHLDGLYNPLEYLQRLKEACPETYVVAEKILGLFEELPLEMKLEGTTGYDFLNFTNGLFIDPKKEKKITNLYKTFIGSSSSVENIIVAKKRFFIGTNIAGDVDNLAHHLKKIMGASRYGRDMTIYGLKRAIVEILAHFPVYRTYVNEDSVTLRDESYIKEAAAHAKNTHPGLLYEIDLIERILLLHYGTETPNEEKNQWIHFTKRFQQLSSALMAKGMEDTVFYIYNRLLSLNEVGNDPSVFGIIPQDFNDFNAQRLKNWKHSMNCSSTHDTKRGEDARARINVISEMPKEWGGILRLFSRLNKSFKTKIDGESAPDLNDEYMIYQTLIGVYPFLDRETHALKSRMKLYIVKAIREAKIHTAWIKPDIQYEEACVNFVDKILTKEQSPEFFNTFLLFHKKVSFYGIFNSLSQVLLKITCPGVPDFYQGTELWDFNMVDPDNRKPVDFEKRKTYMEDIKKGEKNIDEYIKLLFAQKENGKIKLFTIYRFLKARNNFIELFNNGSFIPIETMGKYKNNIIAFMRKDHESLAISIAPRFLSYVIKEDELPLKNIWKDTSIILPVENPFELTNAITEKTIKGAEKIAISDILNSFPVALLTSKTTSQN